MTAKELTKTCNGLIQESIVERKMWPIFSANVQIAMDKNLIHTEWDGDRLIGFTLCRLLKRKGKLSLDKIAVDKEYRNRGIGYRMLAGLKRYGLPIRLDVVKENVEAIRFYERFGFTKTGEKILGRTHIWTYECING
jgi:ribosomal protein S18 acetylase RimI-like enzyme